LAKTFYRGIPAVVKFALSRQAGKLPDGAIFITDLKQKTPLISGVSQGTQKRKGLLSSHIDRLIFKPMKKMYFDFF